jgi:hypothetical protein
LVFRGVLERPQRLQDLVSRSQIMRCRRNAKSFIGLNQPSISFRWVGDVDEARLDALQRHDVVTTTPSSVSTLTLRSSSVASRARTPLSTYARMMSDRVREPLDDRVRVRRIRFTFARLLHLRHAIDLLRCDVVGLDDGAALLADVPGGRENLKARVLAHVGVFVEAERSVATETHRRRRQRWWRAKHGGERGILGPLDRHPEIAGRLEVLAQ